MKSPLFSLAALFILLSTCGGTSADQPQIDGENVLRHVERIVAYGPHPAGSENQKKVGEYIKEQLTLSGLLPMTQSFEAVTPEGKVQMVNIWAELRGKSNRVIVMGSHYDSKLFRDFRFVGANDSGSSSALLLEIAKVLSRQKTPDSTFWFVFFDGEESFGEWSSADSLYGSRHFVHELKKRGEIGTIGAVILLDMVGEKDLVIRQDTFSTPWLSQLIWMTAAEKGCVDVFSPAGAVSVQDDHLPFLEEGIAAVDIIDIDYAYWHTAEDTIDKLSAGNLQIVGSVVLESLSEISRRIKGDD
ncbi:MAG: M28 family peptidase [Acidobacteria bacterium]|nr:M28 family peptidase [Acidobacteriota bacterium]